MQNLRDFLKTGTAGVAAAGLAQPASAAADKMIGIQIGAVSFVDEGTERVLDILQKCAAVSALYLATFTYGRGIAGRNVPVQPLFKAGSHGVILSRKYAEMKLTNLSGLATL